MTRNGWIIFSILCAGLLGSLIFVSQRDKADIANIDANSVQAASDQNGNIGDHTLGNTKSKVILIEYGDFQCPGCGSAHPVIKQVVEKYKDKIGFVFRSFPLSTIHPNALAASSAAEAAGKQGKYWEVHDRLFESQATWKDLSGQERTDYFKSVAIEMGVDATKWLADLDSDSVQRKINFDKALGQKKDVSGTPAFYINGKSVGDEYYLGDKIVSKNTEGARLIWADATAFETLIIKPALKENGISVD